MFPELRMRRLRSTEQIRGMFAEHSLELDKLVMPVFVEEGLKGKREIVSMPGIYRHSLEGLKDYLTELEDLGLKSIILFGIPTNKDSEGSSSYDSHGIVQEAIRVAKKHTKLNVIADLCLCEYTDHGHCGIIRGEGVDNDATLSVYGKIAKSYAEAGVDIVAPSGMMDGQVGEIRKSLDSSGYNTVPIMAYSAKYHTSLYGPFREAANSKPGFGDRKSYQMNYRNSREAIREIREDVQEGADIIMVKPALFYLDIISKAREMFDLPLIAYSVSGEYSAIMNAVNSGLLSADVIEEALTSIFRAGANIVITYFTEHMLRNAKL